MDAQPSRSLRQLGQLSAPRPTILSAFGRPTVKRSWRCRMRIFVISLRTQVERRALIRDQLEKFDLQFRFFDAVDMRSSNARYFGSVDLRKFQLNAGRNPLTNEIGCYTSHLMLWRACVSIDEPIIILEDDAALKESFATAIPFLNRQIRSLGFVRLDANPYRLGKTVSSSRTFSARYCPRSPYSSMAYAIDPTVARQFIIASQIISAPVNAFINEFWRHGQPLYQLLPNTVEESEIGLTTTTIGLRQIPRHRRFSTRVTRGIYRGRCWLRRLWFNLRRRSPHFRAAY